MTIDYLKTFLAVADTGSFTEAAKYLYITQSTVSARIQKLEQQIGQSLFDRFHDHVKLTVHGKTLVPYAEKIVILENEVIEKVNSREYYSERLVVGSVFFFYESYLADFLNNFVLDFPDISLGMVLRHSRYIINGITSGIYDVGFTHHPYNSPDYYCKLISKDNLVLVTNSQNRKYETGIQAEDMKNLPVFYSNYLDLKTLDWLFGKHYLFQFDIDVGHKVIPFLSHGNRYSFLPHKLIEQQLKEGSLIEIPLLNFDIPPLESFVIYDKRNSKKNIIDYWINI